MFGMAMFIFSFFVLLFLDEILSVIVLKTKEADHGICFIIAVIVGVLSEFGLRLAVK